jgi:predicted DNA-binding protein (MmcQ/YjbR family)
LLLQLLLVGFLQDRPDSLLRLEVLGNAPIGARHLAQREVWLSVLPADALVEAAVRYLIKQVWA